MNLVHLVRLANLVHLLIREQHSDANTETNALISGFVFELGEARIRRGGN